MLTVQRGMATDGRLERDQGIDGLTTPYQKALSVTRLPTYSSHGLGSAAENTPVFAAFTLAVTQPSSAH
ncbi:hypothetical protein J1614_004740 [Plenodomus biglobosus]|nr:hypothetical protein J1614_004740 [Plenodomus biglobosus]